MVTFVGPSLVLFVRLIRLSQVLPSTLPTVPACHVDRLAVVPTHDRDFFVDTCCVFDIPSFHFVFLAWHYEVLRKFFSVGL